MKSKAHYKTCVSRGLDPVPTAVDDSCVDEEALAHQVLKCFFNLRKTTKIKELYYILFVKYKLKVKCIVTFYNQIL